MKKIHLLFFIGAICGVIMSCSDAAGPAYAITPPFKNIQPEITSFEIDAADANVLRLTNGSSIEIPQDAFVDKNGKPVTGKVNLQYREFHTAADILTSGIPMVSIDEKGESKPFESGGMFEIGATANGEELRIASDKKIQVHLASRVEGDFDFYYLEEDGAKDVATASLFLQSQSTPVAEKQYRWKKLYSAADEKKAAAERPEGYTPRYFQAHFDTKKYTETAVLDTMKWEYAGISKKDDLTDVANKSNQNTLWTSIAISKPEYYTEILKDFSHSGSEGGWGFEMLPDSLGFVAPEGNDFVRYGCNGIERSRFKNVNSNKTKHTHAYLIDLTSSHLLFKDHAGHVKLFLIDGTFVKDLGIGLSNVRFNDRGNRIICTDESVHCICILSLTGEKLKNIPYDESLNGFMHDGMIVSADKKVFAVVKNQQLLVLDMEGKVLATTTVNKDLTFCFAKHNNEIILYPTSSLLAASVWDWKNNKTYTSKYKGLQDFFWGSNIHPTDPAVIIQDENNIQYLWNWEKASYIKIGNGKELYDWDFSKNGAFIYSNNMFVYDANEPGSSNNAFLLDRNGELVFTTKAPRDYRFWSDENEKHVIFRGDSNQLFILDKKGKLMLDLKRKDAQNSEVDFCANGNIVVGAKNGNVALLNPEGKLLYSVSTGHAYGHFYAAPNDCFYFYEGNTPSELWDFKTGKMLFSYNASYVYDVRSEYNRTKSVNTYNTVFTANERDRMYLWENTTNRLGQSVYRLSFKNDTADFHTYAYLSEEQLAVIKKYQKALQARINQETKRVVEEERLIRSFEISGFGIYNWDRFYKDTNAVFVTATIDLDTIGTDFTAISYFLITGKDRSVVIKYSKYTLDKFRFVPEDNNLLLAVLPGDRIAIYEEEKFRKLNIEEIKKQPAFTFKMNLVEGVASKEVLNRILKKPS